MEEPFYLGTRKKVDVLVPLKNYDSLILESIGVSGIREIVDQFWDEKKEEKLWDLYLVLYSRMTQENYVSFDEFKNYGSMDTRPTESIKEELESIEKQFED